MNETEQMYRDMNDGELLTARLHAMRMLTHYTLQLSMIDGIRAERAPFEQEADVIPLR